MYSFLMLGQSNMAGRGKLGEVPAIICDRAFMLRNGLWIKMSEPVNVDKSVFNADGAEPKCGVSLAASFIRDYTAKYGCDAGLVPCAYGGSSLEMWRIGGQLYTNALFQGMLCMRTSTVAGILWHQGESDSKTKKDADNYAESFLLIMESLKRQLNIPDVPVIMGELGSFLANRENGRYQYYTIVNNAMAEIAKNNKGYALASAEGLKDRGDALHFSSEAQREFGSRYFKAYEELKEIQAL